ncbi:enoyl-CoA hydratase/isomerase family protein [Paracoccus pacificus]|uniref:3-hydroxyisobutyryl-CoA hydrolase n=1 Tax=Paracoccus pacificus TaxID=1463598 RepID=A0ABW4R5A9_9RHOB
MEKLHIRKDGRAGRITFTRPQALNALDHEMALAVTRALNDWRDDPQVELVLIDAEGDRAFCAGGDIAAIYHAGRAGDFAAGAGFFADEYRMNALIAEYPKPVVAFMHGFVMGGGVGVGGHASHRIVGDSTRIAMPESGIGLIPDVGGSWLLAHAPGRMGEYLTLTGARMGPGDAIAAHFADTYLPEAQWPALKEKLAETGDVGLIVGAPPPEAPIAGADLSAYGGRDLAAIVRAVNASGDKDGDAAKALARNSPLSMAAGLALVRAARADDSVRDALAREYRFTSRAAEFGDFLEGVRAQIIDKDRQPRWRHAGAGDVTKDEVDAMLAPLGPNELWKE